MPGLSLAEQHYYNTGQKWYGPKSTDDNQKNLKAFVTEPGDGTMFLFRWQQFRVLDYFTRTHGNAPDQLNYEQLLSGDGASDPSLLDHVWPWSKDLARDEKDSALMADTLQRWARNTAASFASQVVEGVHNPDTLIYRDPEQIRRHAPIAELLPGQSSTAGSPNAPGPLPRAASPAHQPPPTTTAHPNYSSHQHNGQLSIVDVVQPASKQSHFRQDASSAYTPPSVQVPDEMERQPEPSYQHNVEATDERQRHTAQQYSFPPVPHHQPIPTLQQPPRAHPHSLQSAAIFRQSATTSGSQAPGAPPVVVQAPGTKTGQQPPQQTRTQTDRETRSQVQGQWPGPSPPPGLSERQIDHPFGQPSVQASKQTQNQFVALDHGQWPTYEPSMQEYNHQQTATQSTSNQKEPRLSTPAYQSRQTGKSTEDHSWDTPGRGPDHGLQTSDTRSAPLLSQPQSGRASRSPQNPVSSPQVISKAAQDYGQSALYEQSTPLPAQNFQQPAGQRLASDQLATDHSWPAHTPSQELGHNHDQQSSAGPPAPPATQVPQQLVGSYQRAPHNHTAPLQGPVYSQRVSSIHAQGRGHEQPTPWSQQPHQVPKQNPVVLSHSSQRHHQPVPLASSKPAQAPTQTKIFTPQVASAFPQGHFQSTRLSHPQLTSAHGQPVSHLPSHSNVKPDQASYQQMPSTPSSAPHNVSSFQPASAPSQGVPYTYSSTSPYRQQPRASLPRQSSTQHQPSQPMQQLQKPPYRQEPTARQRETQKAVQNRNPFDDLSNAFEDASLR